MEQLIAIEEWIEDQPIKVSEPKIPTFAWDEADVLL